MKYDFRLDLRQSPDLPAELEDGSCNRISKVYGVSFRMHQPSQSLSRLNRIARARRLRSALQYLDGFAARLPFNINRRDPGIGLDNLLTRARKSFAHRRTDPRIEKNLRTRGDRSNYRRRQRKFASALKFQRRPGRQKAFSNEPEIPREPYPTWQTEGGFAAARPPSLFSLGRNECNRSPPNYCQYFGPHNHMLRWRRVKYCMF